jgi:CRP/FNR family cyclic AMP-dependent transcriptional regulator
METESLERFVREHCFFAGLDEGFGKLVCGCAKNVRFEAGQHLFHEGGEADAFYLLRHGRVALEVSVPGRGSTCIQTLREGEVVGLSWLIPPYRWTYDARALDLVRAISIDAVCLRRKLEADHDLGYEMMKRFVPVLLEGLHDAQIRMLDVYAR